MPRALAPGVVVGGRFTVHRKIAAGGMGEIWEGVHDATGMHVAIKTLLREVVGMHEIRMRFRREAELLGRLRTDRVARLVDFLDDRWCGPALVTELIDGLPLTEVIAHERLDLDEATDLGVEIALALRELHRARIVHRDLKPGNIVVQGRGAGATGPRNVVIIDLGVSCLVPTEGDDEEDAATALTKPHIVLGTLEYMAPEQICSARLVNETADVYSLGAILYRVVTGRHFFPDTSMVSLVRHKLSMSAPRLETGRTDAFARGFEALVARAVESEPTARYRDAGEMLAALLSLRRVRGPVPGAAVPRRALVRGWRAAVGVSTTVAAALAASLVAAALVASFARAAAPRAPPTQSSPEPQAAAAVVATAEPRPAPQEPPQVLCPNVISLDDPVAASLAPAAKPEASATSRAARQAHDRQAADAALLKVIKQVVAEEAYMTVAIPEQVGERVASTRFASSAF